MQELEKFILPSLPYGYEDLLPLMSEEQLKIHHQKHHQAYVSNTNNLLEKTAKARSEKNELDRKAIAKDLSFNLAGHILHSLFWKNLRPACENNLPGKAIAQNIEKEFGSLEYFKKEFSQIAASVEGSGWAILVREPKSGRLFIEQIEKHNVNLLPETKILLALDVWEHAYYLDYKNDRKRFIESFWNNIDWEEVGRRLE